MQSHLIILLMSCPSEADSVGVSEAGSVGVYLTVDSNGIAEPRVMVLLDIGGIALLLVACKLVQRADEAAWLLLTNVCSRARPLPPYYMTETSLQT